MLGFSPPIPATNAELPPDGAAEQAIRPAEHLLVLPVPFCRRDGRILVESQALMGMHRWLENFQTLIIAAPTLSATQADADPSTRWVCGDEVRERVQFVPLPWGYSIGAFARNYRSVRRRLRQCIDAARYLQFAIYDFYGDWAGLAAEEAIRAGRRYCVHMDNVCHVFATRMLGNLPAGKRLRRRVAIALMTRWHGRLIRRAALALCHGADCYAAYRKWSPNAVLIHNIVDLDRDTGTISDEQLAAKARQVLTREHLTICYAGRLAPEKAPLDWVRAIGHARGKGARLRATWLGDGPLRPQVQAEVERLGLGEIVAMPGFVSDRQRVFAALRDSDLMLFTHVIPESPRCLIEALRMGSPIVGYAGEYQQDLISGHGAGRLVAMGDWRALGDEIVRLAADRRCLADLIRRAPLDGAKFDASAVFRHRSELIKRHLGEGE
jgi:glycosyltransferase involved in cell wall biosynthesis